MGETRDLGAILCAYIYIRMYFPFILISQREEQVLFERVLSQIWVLYLVCKSQSTHRVEILVYCMSAEMGARW